MGKVFTSSYIFSVVDGRECFKRIALRGCDSIDVLKLTIERAMEKGKVLEVMALPDKVKIQVDEQIRDLTDCQKVEVVFSSDVMNQVFLLFFLNLAVIFSDVWK